MSHLIQGTPEWLEFRKSHVGASDAPVIMGVSPWKTPYQLWQQKLGLLQEEASNTAQSEGVRKEPIARACLEQMLGEMLQPQVAIHPLYKWMMASADAVDLSGKIVTEIKSPGERDHAVAKAGSVPDHYFPQLQHTLVVFGIETMNYFSFYLPKGSDEPDVVLIKVNRDESYIKKMISEEERFIECISEFQAPPLTNKDYVSKNDAAWTSEAAKWREANEKRKHWEAQEKAAKEKLMGMYGGKNCIGGGIKMTQVVKAGAIDYKSIPQLQGVDLEPYRKKLIEYPLITTI